MAGAGYKLFNTGDVLTAAQVNTYLQEQAVMRFASAAARTTALSGVLAEGMVSYLMDTNAVEVYDGSAWVGVGNVGDITGVTAGTGISGGGTSGTVTITNSMATEITAAGDIIVGTGSGTFDNLPIGTTGQVLTADTTVSPYKVKWASASSTPSFVGCRAYKSGASGQVISSGTLTDVTFNNENFDTDGFHDTSTNPERITIPTGKGGKYLLVGVCELQSNSTGRRQTQFKKNGTTVIQELFIAAATSTEVTFMSTWVGSLSAGDYVTFQIRQDSGGNLNTNTGDMNTWFSATYLGA